MVACTVALVAWGVFAFGAVYPWAYGPLAVGSVLVGLLGLFTGSRPVWTSNRWLLVALAGIAAVAGLQLVPLPLDWLARISPGTVAYLARYDLRYSVIVDPFGEVTSALRHAISIAPAKTGLFIQLFIAAALLLAGLLRTLTRTTAMRLTKGIVFVGFALAVFGIAQKAILGDHAFAGMRIYGFWKPESLLTTPFGPFVNKNHFGGWMLMAIPLALSLAMASVREDERRRDLRQTLLWLSEPEGGRMLLYLVIALVMGLSLMMTGSRSSIAALTLMVGGLAVVRGRQSSRRMTVVLVVAAVAAVAAGLQWAGGDARLDRFTTDNESIGMRLAIWRMSAGIVQAFPLLGTGLNTFGAASIVYQQPVGDTHFNEAHNDYVQLLVEGGVVTFVLVLVAIAGVARSVRARLAANDDGMETRWVRVGASTGLVAIGLQALVEFSLQMPGNAVLCVVLLALALYVPAPYRPASR